MTLECGCPEHYPDWDGQDIDLGGMAILELPLPTFLHMPMGYDLYVGRIRKLIEDLELEQQFPGFYLSKTGWFKGQIIAPLAENTQSPSRHVTHLPRPFALYGKLHNGGIGTIKTSLREMQAELFDAGRMPKDLYMAHLTCPICAEQRGGEKILMLRRWEHSPTLANRMKARQ